MQAGKRVGGYIYVHRDATALLPRAELQVLEIASALVGDVDWNVAKVSRNQVSFLFYEDFDQHAFPALLKAWTVSLSKNSVKETDYSRRNNPPILHRKELLLRPNDPRQPAFKAITRLAGEYGLFQENIGIGTRLAWNQRLEDAGLRVDGGLLVNAHSKPAVVKRKKTAIIRPGISAPVALMLNLGVLRRGFSLFDYGCGLGRDVEILLENGFEAFGWDPGHRPDGLRQRADLVNLGFVVNVIENRHEREETLLDAWSYADRGMVVSVMLMAKADVSGHRPHGDGFISSRSTFQKYFTQPELLEWVARTLGESAVSLGVGIVGVFRDKELEQEALYAKRSRATALAAMLSVPAREQRLPTARRAEGLPERIPELLQSLWESALTLGRLPTASEVDRLTSDGLAKVRVSLRRALQACAALYDVSSLDEVAFARREDLLVHGALSLFPGATRYSALPLSLQRDIRHFYGSNQALLDEAAMALKGLRDSELVSATFARAAVSGAATCHDGVLRFSSKNEARLPAAIRIMVGCADIVAPGFSQCDALEVGPHPSKLKGFVCRDFEVPLPRIAEIVRVDLAKPHFSRHVVDDEVLYLKGRYMAAGDPATERQREIDSRLLRAGVVNEKGHGPRGRDLVGMLGRKG